MDLAHRGRGRHPGDRGHGRGLRQRAQRDPQRARVREDRRGGVPPRGPGVAEEMRPLRGQADRQPRGDGGQDQGCGRHAARCRHGDHRALRRARHRRPAGVDRPGKRLPRSRRGCRLRRGPAVARRARRRRAPAHQARAGQHLRGRQDAAAAGARARGDGLPRRHLSLADAPRGDRRREAGAGGAQARRRHRGHRGRARDLQRPGRSGELAPLAGAGNEIPERRLVRITLCENMRAVPYVPFYLALAGGYWESEGLDIRHVVSPSTARTATSLLDGTVDVSWGGPMRVMMHHDADPRCPLVCFAQVVARDPFLLVGRTRKPRFRWRDLAGLRVAPAGDVPTPWMTFQDDLQRAGLDPAAIAERRVRPMARNLEAYRRGAVDVVQVFEPHADRLVRGIARAQAALFAATPSALADAVGGFLPEVSRGALARIIGAYRASGLWAATPDLPPAPFLRLKAALVSGGLIRSDPPYERIVDPEL